MYVVFFLASSLIWISVFYAGNGRFKSCILTHRLIVWNMPVTSKGLKKSLEPTEVFFFFHLKSVVLACALGMQTR